VASERHPATSEIGRKSPDAELDWLLGEVHASIAEERGAVAAVRGMPTAVRAALVTAGIATMIALVVVFAPRADFEAFPPARLAFLAASYVALLVLVASRALRPLHRTLEPAGREMALTAACFVAPFAWALLPPPVLSRFVDTTGGGKDCLVLGIVLGAAVIGLIRLVDRAPDTNFRAAALLAAAGGLVANLALVFHCPRTQPLHLLLVHAPIGLLLLFIARRLLLRVAARRATS
jgi:hypothetical protein